MIICLVRPLPHTEGGIRWWKGRAGALHFKALEMKAADIRAIHKAFVKNPANCPVNTSDILNYVLLLIRHPEHVALAIHVPWERPTESWKATVLSHKMWIYSLTFTDYRAATRSTSQELKLNVLSASICNSGICWWVKIHKNMLQ